MRHALWGTAVCWPHYGRGDTGRGWGAQDAEGGRRGRTGHGGREEGAHRKPGLGPAAVRRVATAALLARDPQLAPPVPSPPPLPPGCCVNTSPSSLPFHKHIPGPWDPRHTLHWAAAVTCRYYCNGHHGANWTGKYGQCHAIQGRKTTTKR